MSESQIPRAVVVSQVLANLAYAILVLTVAAMMIPGARVWLKRQLAELRYQYELAHWYLRQTPVPQWVTGNESTDEPRPEPPPHNVD